MASFPGQKAGASPTAPTTPSNLTATPLQTSNAQIQLQWNPSLDGDVPITYTIKRCTGPSCTAFTFLTATSPNATSFIDATVAVGNSYSYTIQGADNAGNSSGVSNIATAIVPDLTPPSIPGSFAATTVSVSEIDLSWTASTDPDDAVSVYTISRTPPGGVLITIPAPATSYKDLGLAAATTYGYSITATDTHGNTSFPTAASANTSDTTAPTVPANFAATPASASQINLSWTGSTDPDDPVARYTITRNPGNVIVTVNFPATSYSDTGLSGLTAYNYTISATDSHGNTSATAPASATTLDTTPPSVPANFVATTISGSEIDLSWTASTDPDDAVSRYNISRTPPGGALTTVNAPGVTYKDLGLSSLTSYTYSISATDSHGNTSGVAFASATTRDVTAPSVPTNFVATPVSSTQINLSWSASTDPDDAVSLYTITINPGSVIVQVSAPATTYQDTGLAAATNYSFTISATDSHGNTSATASTSATTQTGLPSLNFPRVAVVANGGDQSYGQASTSGFTSYTASGPGTGAYNATQFLGSFDLVMPLGASFEGFQTATRTKQNLVQAIKGLGSFANVRNASRKPLVFLYCIMESSQTGSGLPYQRFANLISANNWWTYESGGGVGTIQPAGASGFFEVNYSYAWNVAVGSAARDTTICGHVYGSLSNGQGPAQSAATYFASALLTTNVLDSRFTGLTNGAAPNADGLFLDNCFIFPNGGGGLSPAASSWDGIGTQSNSTIAAYPSGASSLLARGQSHFFSTMQSYLASCNPGSTYYSIGNIGGYTNTVGNGNIAAVTANALDSQIHGGIMEDTFGSGGNALQSFQTFAQVITNYNFGMDFCVAPKLFCIHARMPGSDGSSTATWRINGAATTVTAGTAAEYQCMRAAMCTALMDNGYFAVGTSGNIWNTTRYYDEFGDDSLAQVNVKRGYLGQPVLGTRPSAAFVSGVWGRKFTNGLVLVNPWLNGSQTITAAQLTAAFGGTYKRISGTQQPGVNSGASFTSYTFGDPDGLILLNDTTTPLSITTVNPLTPQATVGSAYGKQMNATGGVAPYTWSITSDTPNTGGWLSITSAGVLTGTPGTAETETVTIKVTDSASATSSSTFSLVVAGGIPLPLLFSDGFETGDLSHTQNGISWDGVTNTAVSTQNSNGGTHSLRFTFSDATGDSGEQRFNLGQRYLELYITYDLYVPNGTESYGGVAYYHGSLSPSNNKFLRLWRGNQTDGNNGYDTFFTKVGASLTNNTTGTSISRLIQEYGKNVGGVGQFGSGSEADAGSVAGYISTTDRGTWVAVKHHLKAATAAGNDGVIETWKNGALVDSFSGADIYPSGGDAQNGFDFGYLLGFANAGFASGTILMFVDNVNIYGAGASTPAFFTNFAGGTVGASVSQFNSFDFATYDSANVFPGGTSTRSAKSTIAAGGTGFGGATSIATAPSVGDEVWFRCRMLFPTTFNFQAPNNGHLKFMRIDTGPVNSGTHAHLDVYLGGGGLNNPGWFDIIYEAQQVWMFGGGTPTPVPTGITQGSYNTFEVYYKLGLTAATSIIRMWRDGTLIIDTSANIPAGVTPLITLGASNYVAGSSNVGGTGNGGGYMWCTYWNGTAPLTQSAWCGSMTVFTSLTGRPTAVDSHGNAFIGTGAPF